MGLLSRDGGGSAAAVGVETNGEGRKELIVAANVLDSLLVLL